MERVFTWLTGRTWVQLHTPINIKIKTLPLFPPPQPAKYATIMTGPTSCYLHKIIRLWNSLSSSDLSLSSSSIRHHVCDPYVTHFVLNNFLYLCYDCPIASFITWPLTALLGCMVYYSVTLRLPQHNNLFAYHSVLNFTVCIVVVEYNNYYYYY